MKGFGCGRQGLRFALFLAFAFSLATLVVHAEEPSRCKAFLIKMVERTAQMSGASFLKDEYLKWRAQMAMSRWLSDLEPEARGLWHRRLLRMERSLEDRLAERPRLEEVFRRVRGANMSQEEKEILLSQLDRIDRTQRYSRVGRSSDDLFPNEVIEHLGNIRHPEETESLFERVLLSFDRFLDLPFQPKTAQSFFRALMELQETFFEQYRANPVSFGPRFSRYQEMLQRFQSLFVALTPHEAAYLLREASPIFTFSSDTTMKEALDASFADAALARWVLAQRLQARREQDPLLQDALERLRNDLKSGEWRSPLERDFIDTDLLDFPAVVVHRPSLSERTNFERSLDQAATFSAPLRRLFSILKMKAPLKYFEQWGYEETYELDTALQRLPLHDRFHRLFLYNRIFAKALRDAIFPKKGMKED